MRDIIITRAEIKEIAQRIYDDVDSYDFQDSGYMLKDIELEVANGLEKLVRYITSGFEEYAFAGDVIFHSSSLGFNPVRHCDAIDCEEPVRSGDDIWCHRHGEEVDKIDAEAEAAKAMQFNDIPF